MMNEFLKIGQFMLGAFLHAWPYLLVTIPVAVFVNVSGISKYIERALRAKPMTAIFLATLVGAFSPFCSCGVIPVISALLIGGVPLAPVMSFWLASPSMDPEIFFLSVAELGMDLAVWRLAGTFLMSLTGGLITHFFLKFGWLDNYVLKRIQKGTSSDQKDSSAPQSASIIQDDACGVSCSTSSGKEARSGFIRKIGNESRSAVMMVLKFMSLAFLLEALISLYIPNEWIIQILGDGNRAAIALSTLIALPMYTTNLTALGLMAGLLNQGMSPGAVLAFLMSGATTTIPAMAAVYGLVKPRVFFLYVGVTLVFSLVAGHLYQMIHLAW